MTPATVETIKTIAIITGQAALWGALIGWRAMRWVSNLPLETKAKIKEWSPKWYGRLDFAAGLFPNDKQMRRGLRSVALATHESMLVAAIDAVPEDDDATDRVTLTDAPPLVPITLTKTPPPAPAPVPPVRLPEGSGRFYFDGTALPPEAVETIKPRKKP